ncbi:MAG: Bax inhibitor-1/YccA family protein [Hyphomicrobium sp.]
MAQLEDRYARPGTVARRGAAVDAGLRAYMLRVYNYMSAGVALTGVVAYFTAQTAMSNPAVAQALYQSPLKWVIMLAPLAFVMFLSFRVYKMSPAAAQIAFWAFAAVMGVSLSAIFLVFTGASIAQVFFVTAAAFASLSVYGYTTQKDLSGWGSFLIMGVVGIILAALVNIFLQSSGLMFAINVLGVLIFAGLTAYDTQQIKDGYYQVRGDSAMMAKSAIMGALSLYLDFINMFTSLLQLMGNRE